MRKATGGKVNNPSADPILIFVAITLFFILVIAELDLNRDALSAVGLIIGNEGIEPLFAGP